MAKDIADVETKEVNDGFQENRLTWKLLSIVIPFGILLSTAFYAFSVPLIKTQVYELERQASRNILDTVFEIASRIQADLSTHRKETLNAHKRELKTVVSIAKGYIETVERKVRAGKLSYKEGRQEILTELRKFKYGNNDYIWVADYNNRLVSHPDPTFHGTDFSDLRDTNDKLIIPVMVDIARKKGEGFYTYFWRRLDAGIDRNKVSFFKNFPKWEFVLGTGVYLDDVEVEVQRRKKEAINELRRALRDVKLSKTGYVYVFDSDMNMLIHPNANIENTNFGTLKNPMNGNIIGREMIEVADDANGLYYKWDHPDDPGNYDYNKIVWIRNLKQLNWYIASSVYEDELRFSSDTLSKRILYISLAMLVLSTILSWFLVRKLTAPIRKLAETAAKVRAGDLSAKSNILRDDEIGFLSKTFDNMVDKIGKNMENLDKKVQERTSELETSNQRLVQEVSDHRVAREALSHSEERQSLILDAQPVRIAYLNWGNQSLLFVNRLFADFYEQKKTQLIGRFIDDVIGADEMKVIKPYLEKAYETEQQVFEYTVLDKSGEKRITKSLFIPDREIGNEATGVFIVMWDVTEEKQTAQNILEAQRMQAVGQLSGGLAHDFNNILSIILGNIVSAKDCFSEVEELMTYLKPTERAARRGSEITSRLLAFARQHPLAPTSVNMVTLVEDVALLLRGTLPGNINVAVEYDKKSEPFWAFVDVSQLENALINIGLNARDAMAMAGVFTFHISLETVFDDVQFDELVKPNRYIRIDVKDEGNGFDEAILDRVCEPFFTTKNNGAGSGLGLSMVYGFVKQSQGYLKISNRKNREGAIVTMLLPVGEEKIDPEYVVPPSKDIKIGNDILVLLVEDEPDVSQVVRRQLTSLGFVVLEACNADEALILLREVEGIGLLLSDVIMSGKLNGYGLAQAAKDIIPDINVLLISGFAFGQNDENNEKTSFPLLKKPFDKDELRNQIQKLPICHHQAEEDCK